MANTYTYVKADNTLAQRMPDGAFIPWNAQTNKPLDLFSHVNRIWEGDGSPVPNAYVAPPLSPDEQRAVDFKADPDRATLVNHLKTDSLAQIEAFVRNQINADGVTNLATAQQCLKRIETAQVFLFKALALSLRE